MLGNTKLLSIDSDPKTSKGSKRGYLTAIMYLIPGDASGQQLCANSKVANCYEACLGIASGHGAIAKNDYAPYGVSLPDNTVQHARMRRTRLYIENRPLFIETLCDEIEKFKKRAAKKGLIPAIRLNGTSDINWLSRSNGAIPKRFPDIVFYDYSKVLNRAYKYMPDNYKISLSYSQASPRYAMEALKTFQDTRKNLVYVIRSEKQKQDLLALNDGTKRIDGDIDDLRFLDPEGCIVLLRAKGGAKKDQSGFVLDYTS